MLVLVPTVLIIVYLLTTNRLQVTKMKFREGFDMPMKYVEVYLECNALSFFQGNHNINTLKDSMKSS